ncbi:hypothetical protein CDO73_00405 [Saccharibacillus sp. O23]|uniref:hypothetical protein n=1 Tax=Saccharibacillus sp. O23 TaxID=2009338 RepID=UPI000B4E702D|nr:hypothetical protein [Saccharibacillus sp. O23]OWR33005.1 hypothetical protein CDO73_00405 [Saccharibacillus sp. O23]
MDIKARIGRIDAGTYAEAGTLAECAETAGRLTFDALQAEADESWNGGSTLTFTFDYPAHVVNVSFSSEGRYLFDSMVFEPEAASDLPPFPRTSGEMDEALSRGERSAECFRLTDETVYLLPSGATVHYAGEEAQAPLVRIAGIFLDVEKTRAYLQKLASAV